MSVIYLVGSLRNPKIPEVADYLRTLDHEVFDEWWIAGPKADDYWQRYHQARGHSLEGALDAYHAWHVFEYDRYHLNRCNTGVMVLPVGRSGHLELGYLIGQGKPTYILLDKDPERWDIMYRFARGVYTSVKDLGEAL
ncbi:MAG: hypothetical protein AAB875_01935 [Patescibacteria group bacterium]